MRNIKENCHLSLKNLIFKKIMETFHIIRSQLDFECKDLGDQQASTSSADGSSSLLSDHLVILLIFFPCSAESGGFFSVGLALSLVHSQSIAFIQRVDLTENSNVNIHFCKLKHHPSLNPSSAPYTGSMFQQESLTNCFCLG